MVVLLHINKHTMKNYIINIITLAIPINFIWEMVQMPLYKNMPWNLDTALFCFVASIGDAVMILLIFFAVALLIKDKEWLQNLNIRNVFLTLFVGFIIAVLVEQYALNNDMWSYNKIMPRIPFWNIGIVPVLQMLILPLIIFVITKNENIPRRIK